MDTPKELKNVKNEQAASTKIASLIDVEDYATGDNSFIIGGGRGFSKEEEESHWSNVTGEHSCVVGGGANKVSGTLSSAFGSLSCAAEGNNSVCLGGIKNQVKSESSLAIGGLENTIESERTIALECDRCQGEKKQPHTRHPGRAVIIESDDCKIGSRRIVIINSRETEVQHERTTVIGGHGHPDFATLEDLDSIVSIMGCGNETKQSGLVVTLDKANEIGPRVYIKNVGDWDGTGETILEATDVATVIASLTDRIKNLEDKLSKVATILMPDTNDNASEDNSPEELSHSSEHV